ncbi:hypothetical protein [Pseudomonas synxantha]|uniref:Uncharacterized protein n=1 Tax=Pseudomonas synxantha TaxID=47883 RepID=A0ACC6JMP9_9PSED|nr:hypothetical protein [Pseudomonas synxantha]MDR6607532.1 hypothetical protein [Pseudomonas synxantha]
MTTELKAAIAVSSPWEQATLWVNDKPVEWGAKLVLLRGQENDVTLEAPPEIAGALNLALPENSGLNIDASPKFGNWVAPVNGKFNWKITPDAGKSGRITLVFYSREVVQTWVHESLVISSNLADEVTVLMDGIEIPSNGTNIPAGGTAKLSLAYKSPDFIRGLKLALDVVFEEDLVPGDLTSQPPFCQQVLVHEWDITGAQNKVGAFKLKLFSEADWAVLTTPINRLVAPIKMSFGSFAGGTPLLVPPEKNPCKINTPFSYSVTLKSPAGDPLVGVPVTLYAPGSDKEEVEFATNLNGMVRNIHLYKDVDVYGIRAVVRVTDVDHELETLVEVTN